MDRSTRRALFRTLGLLLVLWTVGLRGEGAFRAYQLKAVFLFRFTQFVDWPPSAFATPTSPIVIGVLGPDPFGADLESAVRKERVHNRSLTVQHFQRSQEARNCQVLFISAPEARHLEKVLADLKGRSILTVGDTEDFALRGGMVQFTTEQSHIRFRINLQAVRAANLQMSSKLLELAELVKKEQ